MPCRSPASTAPPSPTRPMPATIFSGLPPFDERVAKGVDAPTRSLADLRKRLAAIQEAFII